MKTLRFLLLVAAALATCGVRAQTQVTINNQTGQLMSSVKWVGFPQNKLRLIDTDGTNALWFNNGSNLTADRTLTLLPGDANLILDFTDAQEGYSLVYDGTRWKPAAGGTGTGSVTNVSVTPQNGVSAVVTNPATTPTLAFTLGAITPSTVNGLTLSSTAVTAAGALGIAAGGSNNSVTLTPTGTGVVNIPSKFDSSTTGDAVIATLGNGNRYALTQSDSAWNGGTMNYGLGLQYNPFRANTSDVNFGLGWEHGYKPTGTRRDTEHYFFWTSPDGLTTRRIYQFNVSWGGSGITLPAGYTTLDWRLDSQLISNDGSGPFGKLINIGGTDPRIAIQKTGDSVGWELQSGGDQFILNELNIAARFSMGAGGVANILGTGSSLSIQGTGESALSVTGGAAIGTNLTVTGNGTVNGGRLSVTNDGNIPAARTLNVGGTDPRIAIGKTGDTTMWEIQSGSNTLSVTEQSVATRLTIAPNGVTNIIGSSSTLGVAGTTDATGLGAGAITTAGGLYVGKKIFSVGNVTISNDGSGPTERRGLNLGGTDPRIAMMKTGDSSAWEIQASGNNLLINEQSVATRVTIVPGGNATFGGNVAAANLTTSGVIVAGSGPTTLTDSAGNILSAALNTVAVGQGGTGLTSGTSGGILYFSGSTTIASSGALAANAIVIGGGAGVAPSTTTTGTGVLTALGVNTGSAGAFQVNNASGAALTSLTAANISTGALANGMTATTQSANDNSTKLATTAYADNAAKSAVEKLAVFSVDGGGAAITTGTVSGTARLPFACTLTGWSISATAATGTNTVKIWNKATGTAIPTISDVINTSGISLTTGTAVASSTLSDFTDTSYAAGDMMRCAITAVDGAATDLTVTLYGTRQ
jgi:hypothetical protein